MELSGKFSGVLKQVGILRGRHRGRISLQKRGIGYLLLTIALGIIAGLLYKFRPYHLGLDVEGGVRFIYQVELNKDAQTPGQGQSMPAIMDKTVRILQNRVSGMAGATEGTVQIKGGDQLIVELPGVSNPAEAAKMIGSSASLKAYWAQNVQTANQTYRRYAVANNDTSSTNPAVTFTDTYSHQTLKPGDPAYDQMIKGWKLLITGNELTNATGQPAGNGTFQPLITFTDEGGNALQQWSQAHMDQGEQVAFVLDGKVLQIAPVKNGSTLGKEIVVEGQYTGAYVNGLTELLNGGALPVDLHLLSSQTVDPTIGNFALQRMVFAGLVAFGVICLFLIVYYAFPGIAATLALSLYCLFTLTVLKLIGATFSLAAIAGFVLSVGMAVDANILVFERFKEEIKKGRGLHDALNLGFKRALPAIFDSNMCSILTAFMLAELGTGPVKGFATTLIIGVMISFFTAVTVTRSLLMFLTDSGIGNDLKFYALNRNWFGEHLEGAAHAEPLQIVNNAKKWFSITAVIVLIGVVFIGLKGLKFNVEFMGGFEATFARTANFPSQSEINANLTNFGLRGSNVQFSNDPKRGPLVDITIPNEGNKLSAMNPDQQSALVVKGAGLPADTKPLNSSFVGPAIQKEIIADAIYGILGSFGLIIIWLAIRFGYMLGSVKNGVRFGATAIATGVKDIVVIMGVAAVLGKLANWELSSLFIPAMLTVVGFSVHDKIVIFDRVRENLRKPLPGETFEHLVNRSVTQSFARSVNTASAVVVTLLILVLFGTTTVELKFFLIIMLSGIAWSTYSSIYTAAPLLTWWESVILKKYGPDATLLVSVRNQATATAYNYSADTVAPVKPKSKPKPEAPAAPTAPVANSTPKANPGSGRSYGQVRRANAPRPRPSEIDDED